MFALTTFLAMFFAFLLSVIAPKNVLGYGDESDYPFKIDNLKMTSAYTISDGRYNFMRSNPPVDPFKSYFPDQRYGIANKYGNEHLIYTIKTAFKYTGYVGPNKGCQVAYGLIIPLKSLQNGNFDLVNTVVCLETLRDGKPLIMRDWNLSTETTDILIDTSGFNLTSDLVLSGSISGKIIPLNWKTGKTVNEVFDTTMDKQIELIKVDSNYFVGERSTKGMAPDSSGAVFYSPFTIGGDEIKYLETGKYLLRASAKDKGSDCSQDNSAGWCTLTWKGSVTFELLPNNKYKIINSSDPSAEIGKELNLPSGAGQPDLINIGVSETIASPFDDFFENALQNMTEWTTKAIVIGGGWVNKVLLYGNDISSPALVTQWTAVRNIALSVLTLGILIIAFANILNFDIEKYGLNRMLPKLILGIFGAFFSFFIARIILEVASGLQTLLVGGNDLNVAEIGNIDFELFRSGAVASGGGMAVAETIFLILLLIIVVVAMLYLVIVLIVRVVVIWFFVALAPLAFIMNILPFTESLFQQWWSKFIKWVFMGPAIAFLLWLTNSFLIDGFGNSFDSSAQPDAYNSWIFLIMAAAGIMMAAGIPMMMGGDIINAAKNAAKMIGKGSKFVPGLGKAQRAVKNRWALRQAARDQREKFSAQKAQTKWATRFQGDGRVARMGRKMGLDKASRRFIAGMDPRQGDAAQNMLLAQRVKEIEDGGIDYSTAHSRYETAEGVERQALAQVIAKNKWAKADSESFLTRFSQDMDTNRGLVNHVAANSPEVFSGLKNLSENKKGWQGKYHWDNEEQVFRGKAVANPTNLKAPMIQHMSDQEVASLIGNKDKMRAFAEVAGEKEVAAIRERYTQYTKDVGHIKAFDQDHADRMTTLLGVSEPTQNQPHQPGPGPNDSAML